MQLEEVAQELRRQFELRDEKIRVPSDEDVSRLVEEGYVHHKPDYYHADMGEFIQAWPKYVKDHPSLPLQSDLHDGYRQELDVEGAEPNNWLRVANMEKS